MLSSLIPSLSSLCRPSWDTLIHPLHSAFDLAARLILCFRRSFSCHSWHASLPGSQFRKHKLLGFMFFFPFLVWRLLWRTLDITCFALDGKSLYFSSMSCFQWWADGCTYFFWYLRAFLFTSFALLCCGYFFLVDSSYFIYLVDGTSRGYTMPTYGVVILVCIFFFLSRYLLPLVSFLLDIYEYMYTLRTLVLVRCSGISSRLSNDDC